VVIRDSGITVRLTLVWVFQSFLLSSKTWPTEKTNLVHRFPVPKPSLAFAYFHFLSPHLWVCVLCHGLVAGLDQVLRLVWVLHLIIESFFHHVILTSLCPRSISTSFFIQKRRSIYKKNKKNKKERKRQVQNKKKEPHKKIRSVVVRIYHDWNWSDPACPFCLILPSLWTYPILPGLKTGPFCPILPRLWTCPFLPGLKTGPILLVCSCRSDLSVFTKAENWSDLAYPFCPILPRLRTCPFLPGLKTGPILLVCFARFYQGW
jgi:hypothetical protein